jgi:hypothetical protein
MTSRFSRHSIPADQHLIAYLLGRLPPGEVERVDELSIVDDAVAERLRAVEDDLVDAYVVGALDDSLVVDFESVYLASALRREKVERARRFLGSIDRQATDWAPQAAAVPQPARRLAAPRVGLLSAAALVVLTCGTLLFQSMGLRRDLTEARRESAASASRGSALSTQVAELQAANRTLSADLESRRSSPVRPTVAIILVPQTRGEAVATFAVEPDAAVVPVDLHLDRVDAEGYLTAIQDLVTNRVVWRSEIPAAGAARHPRTVSIDVPGNVLRPGHYVLELTPRGAARTAAAGVSYVFNVEAR